jgi:hypothetical protein
LCEDFSQLVVAPRFSLKKCTNVSCFVFLLCSEFHIKRIKVRDKIESPLPSIF